MSTGVSEVDGRLIGGRYRLTRRTGQGANGVMWHAVDEVIGREVAVKEMRPPGGLTAHERGLFVARALGEARTAGRIDHPGVVAVHDVLPTDDAVHLVLELVRAPSLAEVLDREGPLPAERVAVLGGHILDALRAAHAAGVVHRDVKPANVMVLPDDRVKLVDFGIAPTVGDERSTREGVPGSTGYMAPELFDGAEPSAASDLWALGVTLCQALTGVGPFERDTAASTVHAILFADPPPLSGPPAEVVTGLLTRPVERRLDAAGADRLLRAPATGGAPTAEQSTGDSRVTALSSRRPDVPYRTRLRLVRPPRSGTVVRAGFFVVAVLFVVLAATLPLPVGVWAVLGPLSLMSAITFHLRFPHRWWDAVEFRERGVVLLRTHRRGGGTVVHDLALPWSDITGVAGAAVGARTRLSLHMAPRPKAERKSEPFRGFVGRVAPDRSFTWVVGDLEAPPDEVVRRVGDVAPPTMRVLGPAEAVGPVYLRRDSYVVSAVIGALVLVATVVVALPNVRHDYAEQVAADSRFTVLAASLRGNAVAAGAADGTVSLFRTGATAAHAVVRGTAPVKLLVLTSDGTTGASADADAVRVWSADTGEVVGTPLPLPARALALGESGDVLAVAGEDAVRVYTKRDNGFAPAAVIDVARDLGLIAVRAERTRAEVVGLDAHGTGHRRVFGYDRLSGVLDPVPSPPGEVVPPGTPSGVVLTADGMSWSLPTSTADVEVRRESGQSYAVPTGHTGAARVVAFPDDDALVTAGPDGIKVSDVVAGTVEASFDPDGEIAVATAAIGDDLRVLVFLRPDEPGLWMWKTGMRGGCDGRAG
ncbi:hypothetical protein GCM10022243_67240 [Saccharothrix violaceirubra]|uniref:tRNA A-37 threonylcarbamoyl transferase component Bud32 n=1 Tax=Saccharothrix violaceirubra TaxID=413306 RepID=A0A7W7T2F9_9PSEU|nr:serine/threonine-protein kinase [Saccharothrix violaceirubra]MBB4965324.1 tRNA A-37 threonylcarbamoyl transferase component Bud32 [Saccharothrix violaceirubra]